MSLQNVLSWYLGDFVASTSDGSRISHLVPTHESGAPIYYFVIFLPKTARKQKNLNRGVASLAPPWIRHCQLITISDIQILTGQLIPVLEVQLMVRSGDQVTLSTLQETMFEENSVSSGISNK